MFLPALPRFLQMSLPGNPGAPAIGMVYLSVVLSLYKNPGTGQQEERE